MNWPLSRNTLQNNKRNKESSKWQSSKPYNKNKPGKKLSKMNKPGKKQIRNNKLNKKQFKKNKLDRKLFKKNKPETKKWGLKAARKVRSS